MITENDVVRIGRLLKPRGVKGEITLLFEKEAYADIDVPYYFLDIDGIYVPFFIDEIRFVSNVSAWVKFEDVEDETMASRYTYSSVFLLKETVKEAIDNSDPDWNYFIGYSVSDTSLGDLGVIEEVDTSTINVLFIVKQHGTEYLIPATEDFIIDVDEFRKSIRMDLPEGLIEK